MSSVARETETSFGRWLGVTAVAHAAGGLAWALPAGWLVRGPGELAGPAATVVMFALTIVAALAQGAILGAAQGRVLARLVPISATRWTVATSLGVAAGWVAIVVASTWLGAGAPEGAALWAALAALGLCFGLAVGVAQWSVLRAHGGSPAWIAVNALGWSAALVVTVAMLATVGEGWAQALAVCAAAALCAGGVIGAATGALLQRMLR